MLAPDFAKPEPRPHFSRTAEGMRAADLAKRAQALRILRKQLAAETGLNRKSVIWRFLGGRPVKPANLDKIESVIIKHERRRLVNLLLLHAAWAKSEGLI